MVETPEAPVNAAPETPADESLDLPVDETSEVTVAEAAVIEVDAAEDLGSPVAVDAALDEAVVEVVSLMPQTASTSNVNGMFRAPHSEFCRWMEARHRGKETACKPHGFGPADEMVKEGAYRARPRRRTSGPCSKSTPRGTSAGCTCTPRRLCRSLLESCRRSSHSTRGGEEKR